MTRISRMVRIAPDAALPVRAKLAGRRGRVRGCVLLIGALGSVLGCASGAPVAASGVSPKPATIPATPAIASADTNGAGLVPPGYGTLRQDDIAVRLQLTDVQVKLTPLDESVIRTLSPDSYRALRDLAESRRPQITRLAAQHGLVRVNLWYVSFFGLAPNARFSPQELTITSGGSDYRPLEILPLSAGFGEERLQPRETQSALYLFDDALDVNQPLTVSLGSEKSAAWTGTLRDIERERALIRSRVQRTTPNASGARPQ